MAHHNTVFAQRLKLVPRHRFEGLAQEHHRGRRFRKTSRWSQFVALAMGQLSGRQSLRDVVANATAQAKRWYHLGARSVSRSTLARVNAEQPCELYEALFGMLYGQCRKLAPQHWFRFKHPLYSRDASVIELSLKVFPWADYNRSKGGMKLHLALEHAGYLPAFAVIPEARVHEAPVAKRLRFPKGSVLACDRGFTDYGWYKSLNEQRVFFVTRQRKNTRYRVVERRAVDRGKMGCSAETPRK